jgi:hypothetical protein
MEYIRNNFLSSNRGSNSDVELRDLESGTSGARLPAEVDSDSDVELRDLESGTSGTSLPAEVDMQLDANEKRRMQWDPPVFKKVRIVPQTSRIPTVVSVCYL